MDGASIYELLDTEKVTLTAAVPTVWLMLLQHLEETKDPLPHLERVVIGGSACPPAMIEGVRKELRHPGDPRLGHDRDEPAGFAVHLQGRSGPPLRRGALWTIKQKQGRPPIHGGDEDHRR